MSIATEIARLQQAKADLKASINAKGGSLTNETLDQYASAVDGLPTPKEEETKTITPDFSSGNVVVTPTSGKVLSQVTIQKDTTNHKAENIKKDITIYGVTGTYEGSGGGADLSKVIPLVFELYTSKPSGSMTLNYSISSSMLDKKFFFDINGNSYLPSQVSVYFNDTLKGNANQNITLYSTSVSSGGQMVIFKVGTLEVGIPTYYYSGDMDAFGKGIWSEGFISVGWSNSTGTIVSPFPGSMRFIQAPNDLFDNFPYYDILDYWKAGNMFGAMSPYNRYVFSVGWSANDPD